LEKLQGQLLYGWLGKADPNREPASFVLFVPGKPGLKVVSQTGEPLPPERLILSVNLRVEAEGTQVGDTFRLLAIRKLQDLPLSVDANRDAASIRSERFSQVRSGKYSLHLMAKHRDGGRLGLYI